MGKSRPNKSHDVVDTRKQLHLVSQSQPQRFQAVKFPRSVQSVQTAQADSSSALKQPGGDGCEEAGNSELALSLETLLDPLSRAKTGREAVYSLLRRVVLLGDSCQMSMNRSLPAERRPSEVVHSCESLVREQRQILRANVVRRLEESVFEGELPEGADVEALATLCVSTLIGLAGSTRDKLPVSCVLNSVPLFVDSLGFHAARPPRHPGRGVRARTRAG